MTKVHNFLHSGVNGVKDLNICVWIFMLCLLCDLSSWLFLWFLIFGLVQVLF